MGSLGNVLKCFTFFSGLTFGVSAFIHVRMLSDCNWFCLLAGYKLTLHDINEAYFHYVSYTQSRTLLPLQKGSQCTVQYPHVSKQYTKYTRYKPKVLQSDDCAEFDIFISVCWRWKVYLCLYCSLNVSICKHDFMAFQIVWRKIVLRHATYIISVMWKTWNLECTYTENGFYSEVGDILKQLGFLNILVFFFL